VTSNITTEEDLAKIKRIILDSIKPQHKVFVKEHTILLHREDALRDGWALAVLCMKISGTDWVPNWYLDLYDTPDEFNWRVILWDSTKS